MEKFKITVEQFFLTVGQNNFGNKYHFSGYIESQSETNNQYRARTAGTTKRRERLLRPPSNISRSLGDTEFYEQVAETIFLQGKPTQARTYELEDCYRNLLLYLHYYLS